MSVDAVVQVRPPLVERVVHVTFYYWAVVLAGAVFLVPESLVVIAINGEFGGSLGPVGVAFAAVGWAVVAVPRLGAPLQPRIRRPVHAAADENGTLSRP
jgi:hypothetical protein